MRHPVLLLVLISLASCPAARAANAEEKAGNRLAAALLKKFEKEMKLPPLRERAFLSDLGKYLIEEREYRARRAIIVAEMKKCSKEDQAVSLLKELDTCDTEHFKKKLSLRRDVLNTLHPLEDIRFFIVEEKINKQIIEIVEGLRRSRVPEPLKRR